MDDFEEFCRKITLDDSLKQFLFESADEKIFHMIVLRFVFNELKPFEVRDDIEIPDNGKGVALLFYDGRIGYFKIQKNELDDGEIESVFDVCRFLEDKFGGQIEAYLLCYPEVGFVKCQGCKEENITVRFASLKNYSGDIIVALLKNKRENNEEFTLEDYVFHMLLPYMGYRDRDEFLLKCRHYMETIENSAERGK